MKNVDKNKSKNTSSGKDENLSAANEHISGTVGNTTHKKESSGNQNTQVMHN